MAEGRNRLPMDPGHAAADPCVRAHRLPGRSRRVDHREISRMVRLRRRFGVCVYEGRALSEYQPILVHQSDRLFILAILRAHAQTMAGPRQWRHYGADRLLRISPRDTPSAEIASGTHIHRYSSMDSHASRRSFCGNGAARSFSRRDSRAFPAASHGACERARTIVSS